MNLLNRNYLINNLCFTHGLIVASCPLLSFAIERCDGGLRDYYRDHLEEELGHDDMLRNDLGSLGVACIPLNYLAAQLAGSQYYLIDHWHPSLLLGYMKALESCSMSLDTVTKIEHAHGVTLAALRHHALHDPGHLKEIERQIALLPGAWRAGIERNAAVTMQMLLKAVETFREAA